MISSLRGRIVKHDVPLVTVDVQGVGYEVQCTMGLWEVLAEGNEVSICTYTFVREDRLELFGFSSFAERKLFTHFLAIPGIGPRTALQLCSVPVSVLVHAAKNSDARTLCSLKGIGKKMAEKLIVELQAFLENGLLVASGTAADTGLFAEIDEDAVEALANLGYDRRSILRRLREMPAGVTTTEERVKRVLQVL